MAALLADSPRGAGELAQELGSSPVQVVPNVIHALLKREVEEKWRDPNGQPYLTLEQHVSLLAAVAEEMWNQGKNSLSAEVVELVCETVTESMGIAPLRRIQVVQRVKAHALLPPSSTTPGELTFDHEEFLNYFLAARLIHNLKTQNRFGLQRFCELHSFPFNVGLWTANIESWSPKQCKTIVELFNQMTRTEVRSSYLKQNAGLITSQLLSRQNSQTGEVVAVDSMYFEGDHWKESQIARINFSRCTFMNVDFSGAAWVDCSFENCRIDGLTCDKDTLLRDCRFDENCQVLGILRRSGDGFGMRNYVPDECNAILEQLGAKFPAASEIASRTVPTIPDESRHALEAFLRIFSRNSGATENVIKMKLGQRHHLFRTRILPKLLQYDVIRETEYSGKREQERFELNYPVDMVLKGEDPDAMVPNNLTAFWNDLRQP